MRLPEVVAHADWSVKPSGRHIAIGRRIGSRYTLSAVRPVGSLDDLLPTLVAEAGPGGTAILGMDFPIGLPLAYAEKAGVSDFRKALLTIFGRGHWRFFYCPAENKTEITVTRPFYPKRAGPRGSTKQQDFLMGLGVDSYDVLYRLCDRGHPDRPAAAALFWTLGSNQVGKAAISGWRDVIAPALRNPRGLRAPLHLWPFDGPLESLIERPGIVITETYPGEIYNHFSMKIAAHDRSKTKQEDRRMEAPVLFEVAKNLDVDLTDSLSATIKNGFGSHTDGDDQFDAVVGLFGIINVLRGNRAPGDPLDDIRRKVEGWILGQIYPCG